MPSEQPIRVLLVDDDAMVRRGLTSILKHAEGIQVVGQAETGEDAIDQVARHFPDVVLMDIQMPGMGGIAATERMKNMPRSPKVLTLTSFDTDDNLFRSLEAGASGFILKDIEPHALAESIRVIHAGEAFTSPQATTRLVEKYRADGDSSRRYEARTLIESLTAKERQIVELVTEGLSNREIAEATYASETTVKTHIARIIAKLDVHGRVNVAVLATRAGIG